MKIVHHKIKEILQCETICKFSKIITIDKLLYYIYTVLTKTVCKHEFFYKN